MIKFLKVCWAFPNTLLGILAGSCGLLFGGKVQYRRGAIEFYGGLVRWLLKRAPNNVSAMTLGHSIIGRDADSLDRARDHEHIHVRQYERWGPAFIPVYLLLSAWLFLRGKNPYYDNPFEVEAYSLESPARHRDASNQTGGGAENQSRE